MFLDPLFQKHTTQGSVCCMPFPMTYNMHIVFFFYPYTVANPATLQVRV